jgi:hypothetical protein
MATPVDRGFVHVTSESDGTRTIRVCAEVVDGAPRHIYAQYQHHPSVVIDPSLRLQRTGRAVYTDRIAEVFSDESGTAHVSQVHAFR